MKTIRTGKDLKDMQQKNYLSYYNSEEELIFFTSVRYLNCPKAVGYIEEVYKLNKETYRFEEIDLEDIGFDFNNRYVFKKNKDLYKVKNKSGKEIILYVPDKEFNWFYEVTDMYSYIPIKEIRNKEDIAALAKYFEKDGYKLYGVFGTDLNCMFFSNNGPNMDLNTIVPFLKNNKNDDMELYYYPNNRIGFSNLPLFKIIEITNLNMVFMNYIPYLSIDSALRHDLKVYGVKIEDVIDDDIVVLTIANSTRIIGFKIAFIDEDNILNILDPWDLYRDNGIKYILKSLPARKYQTKINHLVDILEML